MATWFDGDDWQLWPGRRFSRRSVRRQRLTGRRVRALAFFVNTNGWLVTNAHVVEGCDRLEVVGRGDAGEVKVDAANDLAALRSPGATPTAIALRQAPARLGEDVAALSFPSS